MKETLCTIVGVIGSMIISLLGGWDAPMQGLVICMIIDYVSGLVVAGIFHASTKSKNGALNSSSGFNGLCKKCMILFIIIVMAQIGKIASADYLRNAAIIGFMANEIISILENAKLMGIPLPKIVYKAIDILNDRENEKEENEEV